MAREYVVWDSEKCMGFTRQPDGHYRSDPMGGVTYELERRRRNINDGCTDTGWYLYSTGARSGNFFGEWCDHTIRRAVDAAVEMIFAADLRGGE